MFHRIFRIGRRNIDFLRRRDSRAIIREFRRAKYLFFIKIHGLDLHSASLEELGLSATHSSYYSNSGSPDLEKVLDRQDITADDYILDIGCGKGGALLTMAQYPFKKIDGLDISERLLEIAESNIRRTKLTNCALFHADAVFFSDYKNYNYFYMSHPFPCSVMQAVIANIIKSIDEFPRPVKIIYNSPACHNIIIDSGRFNQTEEYVYSDIDTYDSYKVYMNISEARNNIGILYYSL